MKPLKIAKALTFEEISKILTISPQQIHKIEKEAFNKMYERTCNCKSFTPIEVVLGLCDYLGIQPEQFINKLDVKNKNMLLNFIKKDYGKNVEHLLVKEEVENIEDAFDDRL